ncbi:DEAD/DEAH box helicase [Granulosicoccus antarcticus]|uniref:ATP-dependent RNA helicase DeaD n=1 Tax=Granulosicoccus antarcticus IMCC3135 TaxID=1192854 RepID=A0A2Z2NJZ2_9GAMM|nr:DEAD/DEAH box helicase [Granulosicoccus antarcticus]ASJ70198.1 ATP-dependent RNA helicase DeaD [Granulosicoccus antarcticus IMCC3135]
MPDTNAVQHFSDLALPDAVLRAVQAVGYETPTPIQSRTIPPLVEGRDLLGHAPTGTGKTAAFALPILARMDMNAQGVQALVLAPTRELAIQVAEAFAKYATHMKNLRVLPIYGGQDYTGQIRQLNRGVNVVVGTPGRIMDHMRRGTLKLDNLKTLVLDEADEMLRMGFIDDVEWILEQTPPTRQMALFSATMPSVIRRIAAKHLTDPVEINVESTAATAASIRQRYWVVSGLHKLDALTRILEAETFDGMIVFVRTRTATTEIADKLSARGFAASAMNGDMPQKQREQMVNKLKKGQLDILVATDVVARGLDVDRISHVVNYDIPSDTESYVHRIGRTGRAGRTGDAILFVTQRERRLLGTIERATRQKIEPLQLPTIEMVNNKRIADFKQSISDNLATGELSYLQRLIEDFSRDHDIPAERVAAALARMYLGDQPLILTDKNDHSERKAKQRKERDDRRPAAASERPERVRQDSRPVPSRDSNPYSKPEAAAAAPQAAAKHTDSPVAKPASEPAEKAVVHQEVTDDSRASRRRAADEAAMEMENFRVEVGETHGVKPENLMGAIANEAGLDAAFIGRIKIHDSYSTVELPSGMPKFLLKDLKRIWVCERQLNMSKVSDSSAGSSAPSASRKPKSLDGGHKAPKKAASESGSKEKSGSGGSNSAPKTDAKGEVRKKERHRDRKSKGKSGK